MSGTLHCCVNQQNAKHVIVQMSSKPKQTDTRKEQCNSLHNTRVIAALDASCRHGTLPLNCCHAAWIAWLCGRALSSLGSMLARAWTTRIRCPWLSGPSLVRGLQRLLFFLSSTSTAPHHTRAPCNWALYFVAVLVRTFDLTHIEAGCALSMLLPSAGITGSWGHVDQVKNSCMLCCDLSCLRYSLRALARCICMCVCIHIQGHSFMHACIHIHTHTFAFVCVWIMRMQI